MSATTIKQLVEPQKLTASATAVLYTAPASTVATIQAAVLVNRTAAAVQCIIYNTPPSTAVADDYCLVTVTVPAGKSYLCPELINQKISAGRELHALGNGVTFAVGGAEVAGQ